MPAPPLLSTQPTYSTIQHESESGRLYVLIWFDLCCAAHTVVCANIVKATKFDLSRARPIGFSPAPWTVAS